LDLVGVVEQGTQLPGHGDVLAAMTEPNSSMTLLRSVTE
jgi:hypothetical protein